MQACKFDLGVPTIGYCLHRTAKPCYDIASSKFTIRKGASWNGRPRKLKRSA